MKNMAPKLVSVMAMAAGFVFIEPAIAAFSQNQTSQMQVEIQSDQIFDLDRIMEDLTSELNLTFDQQQKVRAIYVNTNPVIIMDVSIWKSLKECQSEVRKVLTPEQWKKFYKPLPPMGTPMAPGDESLMEKTFEYLTKEYNLSADQQTKIRTLYETFFQKSHIALEQSNSSEYCQKLYEERDAEIKKVLTPEQQKNFDAMSHGGIGLDTRAEERVDRLDKRLKLSADQKKKLTAILEEQNLDARKIIEQMPQSGSRQAAREKVRENLQNMFEENKRKIQAVLTADQKKQYEAIQAKLQRQPQKLGGGNNPSRK